MNAPWSPSRPGAAQRDPFTAFVCDEQTADTLRSVCVEMGWQPEKVNKGGLRNAVQSLSVSASPNILFVDLSESGDPLNDINALAEVCEPGTVVIASGEVNDVRLYRDLLASGIQDYLLKPFSPDQVREAIAHAQAIINAPKVADSQVERQHQSVAVIGVRGGVGASTFATSLSWIFGSKWNRSTALLDLDVHFGTGALSLDLEPGRGLTDAIENPGRIDGLFIERAMIRANEKLAILSAEAPINQPTLTDGSAFYQLQEEMRSAFEATVIDLPRHMLVQYPHLVADVQAILVLAELTLAGARDTIRLLSWLKSNAPQTNIVVAVNRAGSNGMQEISQKDFEASIERKLDFVVPFDPKTTGQAAKLGKSVAEVAKTTKFGSLIGEIGARLLSSGDESIAEPSKSASAKPSKSEGGKSLMGKFAGLKSMMPSKAKSAAKVAEPVEATAAE
jgi:pilus assembly protein CpaE